MRTLRRRLHAKSARRALHGVRRGSVPYLVVVRNQGAGPGASRRGFLPTLRREVTDSFQAKRITVTGRVQGVGFRPFVLRLARELDLKGWVRNAGGVVEIHVEGAGAAIDRFLDGVHTQARPFARPRPPMANRAPVEGYENFLIRDSLGAKPDSLSGPPDCFVCTECLAEMDDPSQRR